MHFLVFGAGYVGKALLTSIAMPGCVFLATTTSMQKLESLTAYASKCYVLKSDQQDALKNLLDECDGIGVFIAPKADQSYEECYLATANAIATALQRRTKPFYLIYTSSTSVYSGLHCDVITEKTPLNPLSVQAKILAETERVYLSCANSSIDVCILRLAGIYGPGRELSSRAQRFSGKEMPGSGDELTNHTHLDDIVLSIQFAINHRLSGVFNVVSDAHPTRKELYSNLCNRLKVASPTWNPQTALEHGCGCKVSSEKIKSYGFVFSHPEIDYALD